MHSRFIRYEVFTESRDNIHSLWNCLPFVKNCAFPQLSRDTPWQEERKDLLVESKKNGTSQDRTSSSEDEPNVHILSTLGRRRVAQSDGSF